MRLAPFRGMTRALLAIALLAATPSLAQEADAIVVVADDGALGASATRAIRTLAAGELRKRGIGVAEDRRFEGVQPLEPELSQLAMEFGVRRIFAVKIGGRLGHKVPLTIEELAPETLATVHAASMTAADLDECDVVTVRLVDAVLDRTSVENSATMRTVTRDEARPFEHKPGERFWMLSLPVALFNGSSSDSPFGFSLGYGYEAQFFRLSVTGGGYGRGNDGTAYFMFETAWLPFDGEITPYIGGGVGYLIASSKTGMGGIVEGGLEAFRLHGVRANAGLMATIPFFDTSSIGNYGQPRGRQLYPAAFVRFSF